MGFLYFIMNTVEIWKDVKGYEGLYQVSNHGNVKRCEAKIYQALTSKNGKKSGMFRVIRERQLKKSITAKKNKPNSFYEFVWLSKEGIIKRFSVHALVLTTFNPIETYETINHKDGNGLNNNIDNLEYMSNLDNIRHYLQSKGQCLTKVKHKETGLEFESLRMAAKWYLQYKGLGNITENSINNMRKNLKKSKKFELIQDRVGGVKCS